MNALELREIISSLNNKNVKQPCPRCSTNNFSIVGESEILVVRAQSQPTGLIGRLSDRYPTKTTMPIIIVTCDNCGYVAQHAKAALVSTPPSSRAARTLSELMRYNNE